MALFKISKGLAQNLPQTYVEGYCYFTTDNGKFYIDTSNEATGRKALNAERADAWLNERQFKIGQGAKSVDGTTNVEWSLGDIFGNASIGSSDVPIYWNGDEFTALQHSFNDFLKLSGGSMLGSIERKYTESNQAPLLKVNGGNYSNNIFTVSDSEDDYQYALQYNNLDSDSNLTLYTKDSSGNALTAVSVDRNGNLGIGILANTDYKVRISGKTALAGEVVLGTSGEHSISADGAQYSGNAATASQADKLSHKLYAGSKDSPLWEFDGSQDVQIPIYSGT